ncbi:nucleotidyltransferase family protein [Deinococcus yavapaiensis]|uniref:MobA-like NTP transferase protein n=1 Tax=Deinococcus yavapaiensis KR-236 TaxID=694435 RepID=A0A318S378_9DEIO|nr:NTP transferase domain-containing protein [Deinococcus yavapaiensis]PYE48407.1 MobA-like NTP transferase protein [Deinococcus yavapaiensis KR-236]
MAQSWNAVVLGGGDPLDPLAQAHGVPVKALLDLGGEPMGRIVLRTLRESGRVSRVAYVGPLHGDMTEFVDLNLPDSGTLLGNLEAGVRALGEQAMVLVVTGDVPLMTPQMLRDVLDGAPSASLVYPVVPKDACEAAFPGVKRTYARLKDGTFTGGNVFLLDPKLIEAFLPKLRQLLALRKKPFALARLIGVDVLFRLLIGTLSIAQLESRVSKILGVPARALVTRHAAIGTDVDKEEDVTLARRYLQTR